MNDATVKNNADPIVYILYIICIRDKKSLDDIVRRWVSEMNYKKIDFYFIEKIIGLNKLTRRLQLPENKKWKELSLEIFMNFVTKYLTFFRK